MAEQDVADIGARIVVTDEKTFALQLGPIDDRLVGKGMALRSFAKSSPAR